MGLGDSTLLLLSITSIANAQPDVRTTDYLELLRSYRSGTLDIVAARDVLSSRERVEFLSERLPARTTNRRDLKAAVLLHTELAFQYIGPGQEAARDLQIDAAETILESVEDSKFVHTWRIAAGYFYQSQLSPGRAVHHLERARTMVPAGSEPALVIGMVHETMGAFRLAAVPTWNVSSLALSRSERSRHHEDRADGRRYLHDAIESYTSALESDPTMSLAHLRRGRCQQLLGKEDEARLDLERGLMLAATTYERGLANLFLGKWHADQQDFERATTHYRSSASQLSRWQTPYFGLSHALQAVGRTEESRRALQDAMELNVDHNDPTGGIWQYYLKVDVFLERIGDLRRRVSQ